MTYSSPHGMREYLFIDGGCLRSAVRTMCKDMFGDEHAYEPQLEYLAENQFDKIFYYDAVPGRDYGEAQAAYEARIQPEHERFARIRALDRFHVALGQIVGADRRQKGVDVRLAVDMMTHAFRGNIARATLFAGDADFVPLLQALVGEGLQVTLWHPPQANADLKGAADIARPFGFKTDYGCLTADGATQAFHAVFSSGTSPGEEGLHIVTEGHDQFAGRWQNGVLSVWRKALGADWSFTRITAEGADLERSLTALGHLRDWKIPANSQSWIEQ